MLEVSFSIKFVCKTWIPEVGHYPAFSGIISGYSHWYSWSGVVLDCIELDLCTLTYLTVSGKKLILCLPI